MPRMKYPNCNPFQLNQQLQIDQSILVLQQDLLDFKQKILHTKGEIFVVQLSQNKRYIALGGERCKLEIRHHNNKKIIKALQFKQRVMDLKFSIDNLLIYVAFANTDRNQYATRFCDIQILYFLSTRFSWAQ